MSMYPTISPVTMALAKPVMLIIMEGLSRVILLVCLKLYDVIEIVFLGYVEDVGTIEELKVVSDYLTR